MAEPAGPRGPAGPAPAGRAGSAPAAPVARRGEDPHPPLAPDWRAEQAIEAFLAGVAAADPTKLVVRTVRQGLLDDWFESRERPKPIHVLAVGKAAPRMLWGLVEASVPFAGVGAAPRGMQAPHVDTFHWHAGEHPIPGPGSLAAGKAVLAWARQLPQDAPVLVLLSGGASACLEVPAGGDTEGDVATLAKRWKEWHEAGLPIEEMNRRRAAASAVKGGRLAALLLGRTRRIRTWLLADTDPATACATVGSGPLHDPANPDAIPCRILASNHDLVTAAGLRLGSLGWTVYRHAPRIAGPVANEVDSFLAAFARLPRDGQVALVGGGEPVQATPAGAPPGGRAQHAALTAARALAEMGPAGAGALFFAAGSDGVDGRTDAAGAWATAADWADNPAGAGRALEGFAAYGWLDRRGRCVRTGPTGTNVNDLWVLVRT